jgi:peptidoglycan/xylan/chitin deacetylase (PgdA/CDA1 family)
MNRPKISMYFIFRKKQHFLILTSVVSTAPILLLLLMILAGSSTGNVTIAAAAATARNMSSISWPANTTGNVIVLTFDDAWKSQYTSAAPILDKYDYKATFFIVCNYVEKDGSRMSWQEIENLQNNGHDIQAHTMNHKDLTKLSAKDLDYELGQSKHCLRNHAINSTVMATPYNEGWDNSTVIEAIAKHYDLARNGNADLMFLKCDKWDREQTDCSTYSKNGSLTFANRYSVRGWSHNFYDNKYQHNQTKIFEEFVRAVNGQQKFNNQPQAINAVPIIIYHNIDNTRSPYTTTPDLFEMEMKYLHDNGFKVFPITSLKYNNSTNFLYLSEN